MEAKAHGDPSQMLLVEATRLPRLSFPRRLSLATGALYVLVSVALVLVGKLAPPDGMGTFHEIALGVAGDSRREVEQFRNQSLGAMVSLAVASLAALMFGVSMLFILPRQRGPLDRAPGSSARSFGIAGSGVPRTGAVSPPFRHIARAIQRGGNRRDAFIYVSICGLLVTLDRSLLAWGVMPVFLGSTGEVVYVSTLTASSLLASVAFIPSIHILYIRKASVPFLFSIIPAGAHLLHGLLLTTSLQPTVGVLVLLFVLLVVYCIRQLLLRYREFVNDFVRRLPPSLQPSRPVHPWQPWRVVELVDTVLERGSVARVSGTGASHGAAQGEGRDDGSQSDSGDTAGGRRRAPRTAAAPGPACTARGGHIEATEQHLHTLLLAGQLRMATLALFTVFLSAAANAFTALSRNSLGSLGGAEGTPSPSPVSFSLFLSGSALPVIFAHSLLHTRNQVATAILHAGYTSESHRREREQEAFVRYSAFAAG